MKTKFVEASGSQMNNVVDDQAELMAQQMTCVTETDPEADPRWEAFVNHHPAASVYHHPAWLQSLEREYRQKCLYLLCERTDGAVVGVLPLMYTRGLPLCQGRPLTGPRLSSLPRTPVAGPLVIDARATTALVKEAILRISASPGTRLQIKGQGDILDGIGGLISMPWRQTYVLRLSEGNPFRIADSDHRASVRRALNKAAMHGVRTRPAETEDDLRAWYDLYLETMRRTVVPARPYRFFIALWELLKPKGMMTLLLAEQQDLGQRRIIAGSIFLMFHERVSYAFGASRTEDLSLRPNDVIQWEAIQAACRAGYRLFDFGEVPEGNEKLARFKTKWGAEPVRLHRYYYPGFPVRQNNSGDSSGDTVAILRSAWRRLPLKVTAWLGDQIYARL